MRSSCGLSFSFAVIAAATLALPVQAFVPQNKLPGTSFLQKGVSQSQSSIKYVNCDFASSETKAKTPEPTAAPLPTRSTEEMVFGKKPKSFRKPTLSHNVCAQTGITLSRYMMEMEHLNPELSEVESIFTSIQVGCKAISKLVRNANLNDNIGFFNGGGSINVQGEEQKKMDVLANDCLKNALRWSGHFKTLASEEEDDPVIGAHQSQADALLDMGASYIAVFDPLDGSSNIDAGIPVGTIFGIFQQSHENQVDESLMLNDVLQPGKNLVAAGYCLYSSATTLVFTLGDGTHGFTLDESLGEFVLTHPNMKIPDRGQIYSANEGNRYQWDEPMREYISDLQQGKGLTGQKYSARYVGSMVADCHRTLQYGGIFAYPADKTNVNGKLRLLYEAAPIAFLMEQAGGRATTGTADIMDVVPKNVHERVPCILGSKDDVEEFKSYYDQQKRHKASGNIGTFA
jgi:fructose-1,6-bisphosphatase I